MINDWKCSFFLHIWMSFLLFLDALLSVLTFIDTVWLLLIYGKFDLHTYYYYLTGSEYCTSMPCQKGGRLNLPESGRSILIEYQYELVTQFIFHLFLDGLLVVLVFEYISWLDFCYVGDCGEG